MTPWTVPTSPKAAVERKVAVSQQLNMLVNGAGGVTYIKVLFFN